MAFSSFGTARRPIRTGSVTGPGANDILQRVLNRGGTPVSLPPTGTPQPSVRRTSPTIQPAPPANQRRGLRDRLGQLFPQGSLAQDNPVFAALAIFKGIVDSAEGRGFDLTPIQMLQDRRARQREQAIEGLKLGQSALSTVLEQAKQIEDPNARAEFIRTQTAQLEQQFQQQGLPVELSTAGNQFADAVQASGGRLDEVFASTRLTADESVQSVLTSLCNGDSQCVVDKLAEPKTRDFLEEIVFTRHFDSALEKVELLQQLTDAEFSQLGVDDAARQQIVEVLGRDFSQADVVEIMNGLPNLFTQPEVAALESKLAEPRLRAAGIVTSSAEKLREQEEVKAAVKREAGGGDQEEVFDRTQGRIVFATDSDIATDPNLIPIAQAKQEGLIPPTEELTEFGVRVPGQERLRGDPLPSQERRQSSANMEIVRLTRRMRDTFKETGVPEGALLIDAIRNKFGTGSPEFNQFVADANQLRVLGFEAIPGNPSNAENQVFLQTLAQLGKAENINSTRLDALEELATSRLKTTIAQFKFTGVNLEGVMSRAEALGIDIDPDKINLSPKGQKALTVGNIDPDFLRAGTDALKLFEPRELEEIANTLTEEFIQNEANAPFVDELERLLQQAEGREEEPTPGPSNPVQQRRDLRRGR